MKCQICDNPATVHLTDIVNKKKRELHLCERCARERKLIPEPPAQQPLDLKALLQLLMNPFPAATEAEEETPVPLACEICGLSLSEFKAVGRFGCPNDYEALRPALEPLLERIHRSLHHAGKTPRAVRLKELKRQMQQAIAQEAYEEAARLRDLIRQLEK
ncbi:MAG: UvrB/UvrC motif-containing protein [Gemmataceae bacterium]|nr:UvrB/UvrC motif-containing protein [Gemmata sp.]MDW8199582.1 UvrB/UvrC motif-containing protein [Gemmataceae bacterium]